MIFPLLVRWACRAGTRVFCSALAALVCPVRNIYLLAILYFNSFVPIAQQAGQAAVLGRLSLSMFSLLMTVAVDDTVHLLTCSGLGGDGDDWSSDCVPSLCPKDQVLALSRPDVKGHLLTYHSSYSIYIDVYYDTERFFCDNAQDIVYIFQPNMHRILEEKFFFQTLIYV
jgi:hypothetical protein